MRSLAPTISGLLVVVTGCASVVQPGFADPGFVHPPPADTTTLAGHAGILLEPVDVAGGAGGVARLTYQVDDQLGVGGEAWGGAGMSVAGVLDDPPVYPVAGGAGLRLFADHHATTNSLVRIGGSGMFAATSKPVLGELVDVVPVTLIDATLAIAAERGTWGFLDPYVFAGLCAGLALLDDPLPLGGGHVGVGFTSPLGGGWHVHGGALLESRGALAVNREHAPLAATFLSPTLAVSAGVSTEL